MPNWKVEETEFDNFCLKRFSYGPYDSREKVSLALQSLVKNIDRCSVIEWSSHNGKSHMTFVAARTWKRAHSD